MKPYGVKVIENPDVGDIQEMGSKSSEGRLPNRSGDYHPYSRTKARRATRRYWARKARRANKEACTES
jgi:hypothetical protein